MSIIQQISSMFDIQTSDQDVRRRGRNVIILALGLLGLALVFLPLILEANERGAGLALLAAVFVVQSTTILLARRGLVTIAAALMIGIAVCGPVLGQWLVGVSFTLPFQLIVPLMFASVTLRPAAIWLVLIAALLNLALMGWLARAESPLLLRESLLVSSGLLVLVALVGTLGASSTARALAAAAQARAALESAAQQLSAANSVLEDRVADRTSELTASLAAQEQQAATLRERLYAIQQLDAVIAELALPIIPIRNDTLVIPLVGALDSTRLAAMMDRVLQTVEQQRARSLLIDVTGVPVIDTQVADALLKLTRAVRLLGAQVTLVGVRPEVAQALIGLGVHLGDLRTEATLQQGLERLIASGTPSAASSR